MAQPDSEDSKVTKDLIAASQEEENVDVTPILELQREPTVYPTLGRRSPKPDKNISIDPTVTLQSDESEHYTEYDIGSDPLRFPHHFEEKNLQMSTDIKKGSSSPDILEVPPDSLSLKRSPERLSTLEEEFYTSPSSKDKTYREVSPFQETQILEQKWQTNIGKIDEVLSDGSALHRGYFNEQLFIQFFTNERTLRLLFKLFDWECKGFITQEKFVDSTKVTLIKQGGLELVELLDVLAYVVCGEYGNITGEHFIKILTSKGVVEKLFTYIVKDGDGCISRQHIMDLIANLTYARPNTGFSKEKLEWLEELFRKALGQKQELSFEDFKKIVHSRNSFFAGRVFEIFDRDKSGSVSLTEFLDAMHQFAGKSPNDKIKFLFRVYDLDGDGLIQREELEQVMKACMEENGMKFSNEQIEDLTHALFEDADTEHRGEITFEALKAQLEKHPGLLENLSISIDRWLVPPPPHDSRANMIEKLKHLRPYQLTLPYLKNNYVYLFFLFFYLAVNLGLFIDRALTVYHSVYGEHVYYIFARAAGQCLNFNCTFILVLILRQSITFLRSHGAADFLPLDQHIYFHKMAGWFIFFFSCLHTVMHLINFPVYVVNHEFNPDINDKNFTAAQWLFTAEPELFGLVHGWANPTGFILMVIITIMVICSLPFVRKSGYFEVFYWSHLLYVAFWILTILHGPHFWKWFVGPAVLFIIEKVYRICRVKTGHGKTFISSGILLPSKVIHLVIHKPVGFHYHPGDYVFINIPEIAKYEWHPLTISSAPEQEEVIWLHIRAVGEWTNRLYDYFENQQLQCDRDYIKKISMINMREARIPIEPADEVSMDSYDDDDIRRKNRKNGVTNAAYEQDLSKEPPLPVIHNVKTETSTQEEDEASNKFDMSDSAAGIIRKKKLAKTTSAPDFDKNVKKRERNIIFRENFRNNSTNLMNQEALKEAEQIVSGTLRNEFVFSSNRSVAMSVRYMRIKPKVITLDMPEDYHPDSLEDQPNENIHANHLMSGSPRNTEVWRGSGALLHKRFSRKSKVQRTRSHEDTLKLRQSRISRLQEAESLGECTIGKPLVIYVDGPYGAPSSHIFRAQHAVLIATGIGVTPFASILQSIMNRYLKARQACPKCEHSWTAEIPQSIMNLKKVDFFWINRNQRSFEWFVNLLSQLEIEQAQQGGALERFLDMHMYITSALQRTDMKAVGLQLALELLHEKEKRDLITGLKTRTNAGRPNWDKVFKQLCNQKKGKITVFYCGPPALARTLRYKCDEFGFDFRKEIF